jgi:membrane protein
VGLLVWFNLVARIYLLAVAWIAVGMDDAGITALDTSVGKKTKLTSRQSAQKRESRP